MRLNNVSQLNLQSLNRKAKMTVGESKTTLFTRDYRSATTRKRMSIIANDFIIGSTRMRVTNAGSVSPDTASLKKAETIDTQKYLYASKYLGGTAIFPKYSAEERSKSIIEADSYFAKEKLRLREKI